MEWKSLCNHIWPHQRELILSTLKISWCLYRTLYIQAWKYHLPIFWWDNTENPQCKNLDRFSHQKISISKICSLPGLACWYTFTMILMMRKDKKHIYLTLIRWPIPYAVPNLLVFPSVFWTLLQGAGKHSCICQKKFWMFWSHCQVVKFDHYHKNTQVCPFPLPQGEVRL